VESEHRQSELPRVELKSPVPIEVDLVRGLQHALLTHPVASQAAFSALVTEGRRFAETAEGREWRDRLVKSSLLRRVRLVFDLSTLGLLEEGATGLPSNYLDALFMMAAGDTDAVLNRTYWGASESDVHGRDDD
jgi:hypothetical protein